MSFAQFFANVKRYNENAAVIFDHAEPIGRATDLVLPRRRWFRRDPRKNLTASQSITAPERS
ncbi:MAG: hypothetical protein ABI217_00965 [Chthoniobacterales bacterium]